MVEPRILILLGVTLVWGTTFPLLKVAAADLSGLEISAIRFIIAALILSPLWWRASRRAWRDGAVLGAIAVAAYATQASGLQFISSNRSAFLTGLSVLLVPFLGVLFFRQRPPWTIWPAAVLACLGMGLLTWEGGGNWKGDALTLFCAVTNALYIIELSRRADQHEARHLAATQIVFMAVIAAVGVGLLSINTPALRTLPNRLQPHLAALVYLGVIATAAMLMLQAFAQRRVSAEKAAIVFAMEPVFASIFAAWWLGEHLGARGLIGGALVVTAMIVSELRPGPKAPSAGSKAR